MLIKRLLGKAKAVLKKLKEEASLPRLRKRGWKSKKFNLSVVAIAKNEADYIKEWVSFHKGAGVTKIILYDNDSTDGTADKIREEIDSGFVVYRQIHGKAQQFAAYNLALKEFGGMFKLMAFIDCDEFLYSLKGSLAEELPKYFAKRRRSGGIVVNWCMYGSGGYISNPHIGGVLDTFLYRAEIGKRATDHVKSVVDPDRVIGFSSTPHAPDYIDGCFAYDLNGKRVSGPINVGLKEYGDIRINHYFTKSLEEWKARRAIGYADQIGQRPLQDFYDHDNNDIFDDGAKKLMDRYRLREKQTESNQEGTVK